MARESRRPSDSDRPARSRSTSGSERAGSFGFDEAERRALARSDRRALARLFDAAFQPVYGYVSRAVADAHAAEDLVQETFMRLQRSITTYRPELPLRPWVFAIASNVLRRHYKHVAKERGIEDLDALAEHGAEPAGPHERPLAAMSKAERARAATTALDLLPPTMREVLVLRHYEGLPFAEVAVVTNTTEEAARQRYVRAIAVLRKQLGAFAAPEEEVA